MTLSWEPKKRDEAVVVASADSASEVADFQGPSIPAKPREYVVDLSTALRLAEAENPQIAEARQRIGEAVGVLQGARALMLPSLNMGANYHDHLGNLQRSSGRILALRERSLYLGGGSEAYAASPVEVPAVSIASPLTDAIFLPLAARQELVRARFDASATTNSVLMDVSQLYFELTATEGFLGVRREMAEKGGEVARLTRAYADAGEGREADAMRAATELRLVGVEVRRAEEEVAVAGVRLARRLHLDQAVQLRPIAPADETTIVDPTLPLPELLRTALTYRPEVRARTAAVDAAGYRVDQEKFRPALPTILVGFSGGAFGGGSNLFGTQVANVGGRTDLDVGLFWTLSNLGGGNLALIRRRSAELGQAEGQRALAVAQVRAEVASAYAAVNASRRRLDVTAIQLESARAGFREDVERIRNTVGRPLEVVNSLQLLNNAQIARIRAVADYNQAEFRLFVSLGSPPPLVGGPVEPSSAPPIASPPLPPLAGLTGPGLFGLGHGD